MHSPHRPAGRTASVELRQRWPAYQADAVGLLQRLCNGRKLALWQQFRRRSRGLQMNQFVRGGRFKATSSEARRRTNLEK